MLVSALTVSGLYILLFLILTVRKYSDDRNWGERSKDGRHLFTVYAFCSF